MWRIKQLHTVNLTYQARFFVRGERPTELLNINFSSKFDKDLGIYYYFCNKWSVKTTLKQCHASVLNNISSIHQPLKQHTHTYTTLTPWNFHLKSSSNDWNPRSATFFLYHTRRPGWTISLSLATPPTQPRTQVSERTIRLSTLASVASDLLNDAPRLDNELSVLTATCALRSVSKVQINHLGPQNPL